MDRCSLWPPGYVGITGFDDGPSGVRPASVIGDGRPITFGGQVTGTGTGVSRHRHRVGRSAGGKARHNTSAPAKAPCYRSRRVPAPIDHGGRLPHETAVPAAVSVYDRARLCCYHDEGGTTRAADRWRD